MQKAIVPFHEICSGCRACELVCSLYHFGHVNPKKSRISIVKKGLENDLAVVCNQGLRCSEECIPSCPVECIKRDDGIVRIITEDCIGCEACVEACPYDTIKMVGDIAIKCDLCDGNPTCVKFCPLHAITYEDGPAEKYDDVRGLVSTSNRGVE
jgi:Fe-S-cluster-containing hydrogenase component 2